MTWWHLLGPIHHVEAAEITTGEGQQDTKHDVCVVVINNDGENPGFRLKSAHHKQWYEQAT